MGRAAIPDIAGRLNMDVRDVGARLAALSTTGLPISIGVECDQQGIRNALAAAQAWAAQHATPPSGPHYPAHPNSGGYPVPPGFPPAHSGGHPVPHPHSGPHSGPHPPQHSGPSGPQGFAPAPPPPRPPAQDPVATWGPPGSASWARGDHAPGSQFATSPALPRPRTGRVGSALEVVGAEGEQLSMKLVEVVDPADFLFTAAGYELKDGERAVVVHTELTNRGPIPFQAVPDAHLELLAADGSPVAGSTVALSSRPPYRSGVAAGETAGGHTVYVLPDGTELTALRWRPAPDDERRTLNWDITDL
nr:AsnC family protein [Saccharopolyspora sp. HNM0983]